MQRDNDEQRHKHDGRTRDPDGRVGGDRRTGQRHHHERDLLKRCDLALRPAGQRRKRRRDQHRADHSIGEIARRVARRGRGG
jgi:hypothetical protein